MRHAHQGQTVARPLVKTHNQFASSRHDHINGTAITKALSSVIHMQRSTQAGPATPRWVQLARINAPCTCLLEVSLGSTAPKIHSRHLRLLIEVSDTVQGLQKTQRVPPVGLDVFSTMLQVKQAQSKVVGVCW